MSKNNDNQKDNSNNYYDEIIELNTSHNPIIVKDAVRPNVDKQILDYQDFDPKSARNTGGVSGSMAMKHGLLEAEEPDDRRRYQVKFSNKKSDVVNFGEFIASTVSREILSSQDAELVPKVYLVHKNDDNPEILVASRYLDNTIGTIDQYAEKSRNVNFDGKHVKVSANTDDAKKLNLGNNSSLRKDLARAIVLSALSGDNDINPGNMMVVLDKDLDQAKIARIDFGHAFNELLNYATIFGGRIRNKENRILDFFNRESVGGGASKLWRDYEKLIPSQEFADALQEISSSKNIENGLNKARDNFIELLENLSKDPKKNAELINHMTKSLADINNGESMGVEKINIDSLNTQSKKEIVNQVFDNLKEFYQENQRQMSTVAKLMQTQVNIDQMIMDKKENKPLNQELINDIQSEYEHLKPAQGIGISKQSSLDNLKASWGVTKNSKTQTTATGNEKINWLKTNASSEAFKGTLEEYIKTRSKQLGLHERQARDLVNVVSTTNKSPTQNLDDIMRSSRLDTKKLSQYISLDSNSTSASITLDKSRTSIVSTEQLQENAKQIGSSINNKEIINNLPDTRKRRDAIRLPKSKASEGIGV